MNITYFYSREYVNMPFIKALQQNNINTKAIHLSTNQFTFIKYLEKVIQSSHALLDNSFIITDDPGIPSTILNIKNILKFNESKYVIRLRGDFLREDYRLGKNLMDFNIKGSNAIFHVAKYLEQKYRTLYPSKRHYTIYNGINIDNSFKDDDIDISKYLKLTEKAKIKILIVMNFEFREKIKYIKGLLPIIKRITHEYSALFVFIGGGKYLSEIKSIFYGQKGIMFLGRLPRIEVLKLMPYFDIFYYPTGLDVLPNVILEASISGLPVISNSVGGIPEMVLDKETGFLMKNIEKDSYRYLKLLIEDEGLRYNLSMLGKDYVTTKFDLNKVTNDFVKIVKSEIRQQ